MGSLQYVCVLLTISLFCIAVCEKPADPDDKTNKSVNVVGLYAEHLDEANNVKEPADSEDKTKKSVSNFVGQSAEHFKEAVEFIKESELYNKIQDILVHYVQHFVMYSKMTMRTERGKKTVPISDEIERNLSTMVTHIMHVEHVFTATKNESFDLLSQANKFRFIRNNTVLLDKVIQHVNETFQAHGDIENPEKLEFYHKLKSDARFFKTEHLEQSIKDIIKIQKDASPSFSDLATGKLFGSNSEDLNPDECLHIGEYSRGDNVSYGMQFYEAAVRRLDTHDLLMINKSQILEKVRNFYSKYGPDCQHRVFELQVKLEIAKDQEKENVKHNEYDNDDDNESIKDISKQEAAEKQGKAKHQHDNMDKASDSDEVKSNEKEEIKEIYKEMDKVNEDKAVVDKKNEMCFREIIKRSSILSTAHDEF